MSRQAANTRESCNDLKETEVKTSRGKKRLGKPGGENREEKMRKRPPKPFLERPVYLGRRFAQKI